MLAISAPGHRRHPVGGMWSHRCRGRNGNARSSLAHPVQIASRTNDQH